MLLLEAKRGRQDNLREKEKDPQQKDAASRDTMRRRLVDMDSEQEESNILLWPSLQAGTGQTFIRKS